jgi:hypothetical protein
VLFSAIAREMLMIPSRLYKYQSINCNSTEALSKHAIWFSKPKAFNDPFDSNMKINGLERYFNSIALYVNALGVNTNNADAFINKITSLKSQGKSEAEIIQQIESELISSGQSCLKKQFDEIIQAYDEISQSAGILSLTTKNNNLLMWAHYANNHEGICLEFSTTEASEQQKVCTLADDSMTFKVDYVDYYPRALDMNLFDSTHSDRIRNLFLLKSKEWEYEEEWRVINKDGNKLLPHPGKLTGIIFGARVSDQKMDCVINAIKGYNSKPQLYQSITREDAFMLEIVKI